VNPLVITGRLGEPVDAVLRENPPVAGHVETVVAGQTSMKQHPSALRVWCQGSTRKLSGRSSLNRRCRGRSIDLSLSNFKHLPVLFVYEGNHRPLALFDTFAANKRAVYVDDYQCGPYLLDPFYLACTRGQAPGLWRLRQFAPDHFYLGEYYLTYYQQTGLVKKWRFSPTSVAAPWPFCR